MSEHMSSTPAGSSALVTGACSVMPAVLNNGRGDYIMGELGHVDDDDDQDRPTKSYVCHVCQYIGPSQHRFTITLNYNATAITSV